MKIGRNKPCPCGSGVKYKKCCIHLDRESKKVRELNKSLLNLKNDKAAYDFLSFYNDNLILCNKLREKALDCFHKFMRENVHERSLSSQQSCELLDKALDHIISMRVFEKVGKKGIYFWLVLERRISVLGYMEGQFRTEYSALLAKQYFSKIIYQHAKMSVDKIQMSVI